MNTCHSIAREKNWRPPPDPDALDGGTHAHLGAWFSRTASARRIPRRPVDRTDVREKRRRHRGGRGREVKTGWEGRIQPPWSLLSAPPLTTPPPTSVSPLVSPSYRIYKNPFRIRWRLNFHYISDMTFFFFLHSAEFKFIWNAVHNIPMTTVMYCTNTHWIRMMTMTIYGEVAGRSVVSTSADHWNMKDLASFPPSVSFIRLTLKKEEYPITQSASK